MRFVEHEPEWVPSKLPVNASGDLKPGFVCVHELENGNGPCGGNVFRLEDAVGTHGCVVTMSPWLEEEPPDDIGDPPTDWCPGTCECGKPCGEFVGHRPRLDCGDAWTPCRCIVH